MCSGQVSSNNIPGTTNDAASIFRTVDNLVSVFNTQHDDQLSYFYRDDTGFTFHFQDGYQPDDFVLNDVRNLVSGLPTVTGPLFGRQEVYGATLVSNARGDEPGILHEYGRDSELVQREYVKLHPQYVSLDRITGNERETDDC